MQTGDIIQFGKYDCKVLDVQEDRMRIRPAVNSNPANEWYGTYGGTDPHAGAR